MTILQLGWDGCIAMGLDHCRNEENETELKRRLMGTSADLEPNDEELRNISNLRPQNFVMHSSPETCSMPVLRAGRYATGGSSHCCDSVVICFRPRAT